ncbi:MAG: polyprenyl synthetase family protein [Ruminococcaceae bacterium]|nr:polyprenyl synthetase family protein [Oscillospiraceae bacterium]
MDFLAEFEEKINQVNQSLQKYFMKNENYQMSIYDAMEYSLFSGGKRIRPVLCVACAELFGNAEDAMPFACAIEMIHTYSLIHDDLPCMDDDDLRRGKPTNHIIYGEAMAVLAGDALLNLAFETALQHSKATPAQTLEAVKIIAESAGTEGMIGGQVIDLESEGKDVDAVTLMAMHVHKTGALMMAPAKVGALIGGGTKEDILNMEKFARYLGVAFQIKDDILDVESTTEILGKPIGSDKLNEKTTFVTLYGMEQSRKMLEDYTQNAIATLEEYGDRAAFLKELSLFLLRRDR